MSPSDYLKRLRRVDLRSRLVSEELMMGQSDAIFKGRGMDFTDVREYAPGDDVRRIDWNVSARLRKTFIKRHVEERELTVQLLVDLSASGHFGTHEQTKRELAAELAGTLAWSAIRNNNRVGLVLFTDTVEHYVPPRKSRQQVQRLLRDLLLHAPRSHGTSLSQAIAFATRVTHRPALFFVISDFHDSGYEQAMKAANQRHEILAMQLTDTRERQIPDVGLAWVEDSETGEAIEVDTSDPLLRAAFAKSSEARQQQVYDFFRRSRIAHLELPTHLPWVNPLRTFLTLQARRRVR